MRARGRIFLIDDEELMVSMLSRALKNEGYDVRSETEARDAVNKIESYSPDIVLLDIALPGQNGIDILQELKNKGINTQVVMLTADATAETAVNAMKLGAADYITKPFNIDELKIIISNIIEKENLKQEVKYLRKEQYHKYSFENIVAQSGGMKDVITLVKKIAESDANTILIQGESGTGKSLIARAIHYHSSRTTKPFVEVTCTALPETLVETELFGYEKGAFTDAKASKKGLFEFADRGTIYLDEIGDITPSTQAKLLRVIEEKTFKRVGSLRDITVNIRIIAATNKKDLEGAVREGSFREDLYYRLKVIPIFISPLRKRKEDVIPLAMHYLTMFNKEFKKNVKGISREAEELLINYPWHGNARELKNIIERICILEDTDIISPHHIPSEIVNHIDTAFVEKASKASFNLPPEGLSLKNVEKELIVQALQKADGNQTKAAKLLGVSRDALRYKMQKFEIL